MDLIIRRAKPADAPTLVTFNTAMALETEDKRLSPERLGAGVQALLRDATKGFYLVSVQPDSTIVGQLMVTFEWSDWRNAWFWWIQSVYVAPAARRSGIYRGLHDRVISLAREDGTVCGVRLYVHHDNARAQRTYEAMGMSRAHYELFEVDL